MYGFGGRHLKVRDVSMDLEPCFKVHNLLGIQLNNTKLGQITNLDVIFYMVVLIYKLDQICNSPQSPAQPQPIGLECSNSNLSLKTNKAVGLDKLSARLLKDASDVIAPILTGLINKSFADGVFPGIWKSAKVTALFKDGDKSLKDNYRPISILPTISKIIERSAHVQLSSFLEENRLLSQSQFGFRLKRSTSTVLIAFTDEILESMDKGCVTGAVFLDLRKAFDTVDHLLLISKRTSLGVAGKSLEWFRSYLSGRVQQTICDNVLSPPAKITMGVPQGSILGPLLFLVYINGIQSVLQHSRMTMFADDMRTHQLICNQSSMRIWQQLHLGYVTTS